MTKPETVVHNPLMWADVPDGEHQHAQYAGVPYYEIEGFGSLGVSELCF